MKLLVTGGAGFIGSNFVRYLLEKNREYKIVVLDNLTHAGRKENLLDVLDQIEFIKGDICNPSDVDKAIKDIEIIFNLAAETHVDRSIIEAGIFVKTNILGTHNLLEAARKNDVKKYVQISTDEVYGSIDEGSFKEDDLLDPSSPYSASKAGADLLARAYYKTYGLNVLITRSSNNFGPYQHPEKLIPKLIINALQGKPLPIYGDGLNVRDWIYVLDNCEAIDIVSQRGKPGEIYNIGASNEKRNIDVVKIILKRLGKPERLIKFVNDRPGHDRRYSLDISKIEKLGWKPRQSFENNLNVTIKWYEENEWWWKPLI
jgi:dTDP-glucose 4,6-dehydratase